eukprot:2751315-Rhodomonas_salina.2
MQGLVLLAVVSESQCEGQIRDVCFIERGLKRKPKAQSPKQFGFILRFASTQLGPEPEPGLGGLTLSFWGDAGGCR